MANYNYNGQGKSQQDGLERVISMRQNIAASKAHKGDLFMILLIAGSCLVSFQFRGQATALASQLHALYSGRQVAVSQDAKSHGQSASAPQAKHSHKSHSPRARV